jgi:superfamily II DNA/RNA helicase
LKQEADVFTGDKFQDLPLNDKLKQMLQENGYEQLTTIQKSAIPVILKHQNVAFKSETGSGKTLAYLVPLLEYLSKVSLT